MFLYRIKREGREGRREEGRKEGKGSKRAS